MAARRQVALVLGGAAVKGAFEAGALEVITARGIGVRRIVAASSGALNGTAYAAGVRARREADAARDLVDVWVREANLRGTLHPSLRAILGGRGISDQRKLLSMLRGYVKPSTIVEPAPIDLHIVVAPLCGVQSHVDGEPATTYSRILSFTGPYFDDPGALEHVFLAATASAALPVLYAPVDVPGVGPCSDGGLVNDTPILPVFGPDQAPEVDAVLVVTPTPALVSPPGPDHRGVRLVMHQMDMIFAEWQFQELRRAVQQSASLGRIDRLAAQHRWSAQQVEEVKAAAGLDGVPNIPIISIRPSTPLPGNILSGLFSSDLRRRYVDVGRERAARVLDELGWT